QLTEKGIRFPDLSDNNLQTHLNTLQSIIDIDQMFTEDDNVIDLKAELENRMELPDPSELHDAQLTETLHEVIDLLAQFHFKMDFTDHLDDRELYQAILTHILEDPIYLNDSCKGALIHHDVTSYDLDAHEEFY